MSQPQIHTTAVLDEPRPTAPPALRVLVVDDHRAFAEMLAAALETVGMQSVGVAHSAAQAVSLAEALQPDVVIMDIQLPDQNGLAATRRIREVAPGVVVAIVTAHRDPDWVIRATQAGAAAFISKAGPLAEMLEVLTAARAGQMVVAPSTFARRPSGPVPEQRRIEPVPQLTRRERQVLDCLSSGMQVKAIARVLGIGEATCREYVKTLHVKLCARSQVETIVRAQQMGLLGD
jgi:DNA-binding NarL/FixJ family response regulator